MACWIRLLSGQFLSADRFPCSPNALHLELIDSCPDSTFFHPQIHPSTLKTSLKNILHDQNIKLLLNRP